MARIIVNEMNKTISISKAMHKKASVFGSVEYDLLHKAKKENPYFKVVITTQKTPKGKKLTKDFMERYLNDLPDTIENKANKKAFSDYVDGLKKVGKNKPKHKFGEITKWFVKEYPNYNDYSPIDAIAARARATIDAETASATF